MLEQLAGAVVIMVALADGFHTILYARMGTGLIAMRYAHGIERLWVWLSRAFGRSRARFVSFCGPVTLLAVLGLWTGLLTLGSALELRSRWDGLVQALAPTLAFSIEEVDVPLAHARSRA